MYTICITAAQSKSGKTTLAERLLSHLDGWAACKVTVCSPDGNHRCPRGNDACGVCTSLDEDYLLEEVPAVIEEEGKDTWRYRRAGAARVIWIKTKPDFLRTAVFQALERLSGFQGVVVEGNHALQVLDPDVAVMVLSGKVGKSGKPNYKPSAKAVLDKIDLSGEASDPDLLERILEQIGARSDRTTDETSLTGPT
jgi:molybdopterin-guanine dinucleotide biosynthesis protein